MNDISQIPAVILVGGLGTRLRSAIGGVPKAMAPVGGKPFLHHLLDWLSHQGIRNVVLCTGYLGDRIRDYFGHQFGMLSIAYSHEEKRLGTAGALRHSLPKIQHDIVLAANGDTFCDADLKPFLTWHSGHAFNASILLSFQKNVQRYGRVVTDPLGRIVQFHEKGPRPDGGYVSAGIYLLNRSVIESMPEGRNLSLEYELFPGLIGKGLSGYKTRSAFIDIGTPESFQMVQSHFQQHAIEGVPGAVSGKNAMRFNENDLLKANRTAGDLS